MIITSGFFIAYYLSRCVADEHRALALGLQSAIFRLFGNIPGPIVFGVIFDSACIYFRYDIPCDQVGNCWVYNNYQLSWSVLATVLIGICANFIFSFLSWLFYPKKNVSGKTALASQSGFPLTNKSKTAGVGNEVLPEKLIR